MELVNTTCLPAELTVARLAERSERAGILTAKATFRMAPSRLELERQRPMALTRAAQKTELGELPSDFLPRSDERFEVMVLGCAYSPSGEPVRHRTVAMSLGSVRRELSVTGDRTWMEGPDGPLMSDAAPFVRMPLTWDRAFGGASRVEIAPGVTTLVVDPINPAGRGFDPLRVLGSAANVLSLPEGYPRVAGPRALPNVEAPEARLTRADETPPPACWAPLPTGSLLRVDPPHPSLEAGGAAAADAHTSVGVDRACFNACSEWVLDRPAAGTQMRLEGLSQDGPLAFALPELRVVADYAVDVRSGTLPLTPMSLLVLAEEHRALITYRCAFRVDYEPAANRSLRLRLE